DATRYDCAGSKRVATSQKRRIGDLPFGDTHRRRHLGGRLLERCQFGTEPFQFSPGCLRVERFGHFRQLEAVATLEAKVLVRVPDAILDGSLPRDNLLVVDGLACQIVLAGERVLVPPGDLLEGFHGPGALEDTRQTVVIGRGDRVELVVMAAGAAEGQPEEG